MSFNKTQIPIAPKKHKDWRSTSQTCYRSLLVAHIKPHYQRHNTHPYSRALLVKSQPQLFLPFCLIWIKSMAELPIMVDSPPPPSLSLGRRLSCSSASPWGTHSAVGLEGKKGGMSQNRKKWKNVWWVVTSHTHQWKMCDVYNKDQWKMCVIKNGQHR